MGAVNRYGRAWVFGDDIDTDALAPGLYMKAPFAELVGHCLESVDADFAANVAEGDIVVAGDNFGIGSSREQAAQALQKLGVRAVLARSFGGIFFRNALNLGLVAMPSTELEGIHAGDLVAIDLASGIIHNQTRDETYRGLSLPPQLLEMVQAGGLVAHLEMRLTMAKTNSLKE